MREEIPAPNSPPILQTLIEESKRKILQTPSGQLQDCNMLMKPEG